MARRSAVVVVPTIRESSFKRFVSEWTVARLFESADLIVVEDNPHRTFDTPTFCARHVAWDGIEAELRDRSWVVPRRSDCVRSAGYFLAWLDGYELVATLDDDCYPDAFHGADLVTEHRDALDGGTRWWNTLNAAHPRGIPYCNMGVGGAACRHAARVNHGLWSNVLDLDASTQLVAPCDEVHSGEVETVPPGSYFPMCGMNVAWRREATPLMYHMLMGWCVDDRGLGLPKERNQQGDEMFRLPYDRFGDIWCGVMMKRIADELRWAVTSGSPIVRHDRASDPFANLKKEAAGVWANETLWEHVDAWAPPDGERSPARLYASLGEHVGAFGDTPLLRDRSPEAGRYFKLLGRAMRAWASLFDPGLVP